MLAHGRFQTETPNVVDPGEESPSRPARVESDSELRDGFVAVGRDTPSSRYQDSLRGTEHSSNRNISTGTTSSRQQQSNKGTISKGVRIHYMLDADDEPEPFADDGDYEDSYACGGGALSAGTITFQDPEYGGSRPPGDPFTSSPASSGHSIEQARRFAAAMLDESDRRRDGELGRHESALQKIVRTANNSRGGNSQGSYYSSFNLRSGGVDKTCSSNNREEEILILEDSVVYSHDPKRFRRLAVCRAFACLAVVGLVMAFSIIAVRSSRSPTGGDGSSSDSGASSAGQPDSDVAGSMTPRLEATVTFLIDREISMARDLYDPSSAQYKAAHWIANIDSEQLLLPAAEGDAIPLNFVQRYTLAVLYYSWNGDVPWTYSLNFTSGSHECGWYQTVADSEGDLFAMGVGCDQALRVRSLLFPSNNLKGSIPDEIQHLSTLKVLNLKENALTGSFPASLKKLTQLDFLEMSFNRLTGSIPLWLGDSLGALKVLGLGHNLLHGTIPESLGSSGLSANLKTLSLDNNFLTGDASTIQRLRNLEYLYISNNDLSGRLDAGLLSDMPFLEEADLSHNRFSKRIPNHLLLMQRLRVLDLGQNDFSGSLPSGQEYQQDVELPPSSMQFFSLRNNSMSSNIPESLLEHWTSLTHLDLSMNDLTGEYPAAFGGMVGLNYLFLGENRFKAGPVPQILQSLKNLRELSLDNLQLQGTIPSWLENLGQLRLLDLSSNSLTGSISLDFEALADLVFLMLNDNLLTGPLPGSVVSMENLVVLSLHHNNMTGDVADSVCTDESTLELVALDCGAIACPCCDACCGNKYCFQDVLWDTLEHYDGKWEKEFQRDDYAFNPKITITGGQRGSD